MSTTVTTDSLAQAALRTGAAATGRHRVRRTGAQPAGRTRAPGSGAPGTGARSSGARRVRPSGTRPQGAAPPELATQPQAVRSCREVGPVRPSGAGMSGAGTSAVGEWRLTARGVAVVSVLTMTTFVLALVAMVSRFLLVSA